MGSPVEQRPLCVLIERFTLRATHHHAIFTSKFTHAAEKFFDLNQNDQESI
jgi:hypothetical protein